MAIFTKFDTGEFYLSERKIFRAKVAGKNDIFFAQVLTIFDIIKYRRPKALEKFR